MPTPQTPLASDFDARSTAAEVIRGKLEKGGTVEEEMRQLYERARAFNPAYTEWQGVGQKLSASALAMPTCGVTLPIIR